MDMNLPQPTAGFERVFDGERIVLERASMSAKSRSEPIVNPARWAKQAVMNQACQSQADTKAFKGRGKLYELRQLLTELDVVVQAMKELVDVTKEVQDSQMYLMLHVKTATGLTYLRWRERLGVSRHVPWPEVVERIEGFVPDVRDWYQQATEQAMTLNEQHKELRRAITTARKVVMKSAPALYARPLKVPTQSIT